MTTATRSPFVVRDALVVQTYVVPDQTDRLSTDFYEVHVAPDFGQDAPRIVLVTRKVELYAIAAAIEGTAQRVTASWEYGRTPDGRRRQVLTDLEVLS